MRLLSRSSRGPKRLEVALNDVLGQIESVAFTWFEKLRAGHEVLRVLQEDEEDMSHLWGFGNFESHVRNLLTGFVALHANDTALGSEKLRAALAYENFAPIVLPRLQQLMNEPESDRALLRSKIYAFTRAGRRR